MQDPHFVLYIATTLDGYVASTDGSIEWLTSLETHGEDNGYSSFYETIDALVMGSSTYEQVLGFGEWVYAGKPSYVLTSRSLTTERDDVIFMPDIDTVVADIYQRRLHRIWIVGGGKLASLFMTRGLVNEYILSLIPIILGTGISLYQSVPTQKLTLVQTKAFASGVVELRYEKH
jgi:dihydrofolate reductase